MRSQYLPFIITESRSLGTRAPEPRLLIISLSDTYTHWTRAYLDADGKDLGKVEGEKMGAGENPLKRP